jgi:signal transduction histidine kinase
VTFGQSPRLSLEVMNRAFSRFAHVVGYVNIIGVGIEVIGYIDTDPVEAVWPALVALAIMGLTLVALDRRTTTLRALTFLIVGAACVYWFALTILAEPSTLRTTDVAPLTMLKIALMLVGGASQSAWRNIIWCTSGFVIAEGVTAIAATQTGALIQPDATTIIAEIALVMTFVVIGTTRARLQQARPHLDQAAMDERVSAIRYRIEVKAAALMHDTVLSHLAAISHASLGALNPDLKRQMETDLEVLIGEEWLSDTSPELDSQARSDWRRSMLLAGVQEVRAQSLAVEVTGDLSAVSRLSPERDVAVGLAVKQCLVNVLKHADIRSAEVVIIGSETDVSVMVIDAGRGFDEALVGADRLGIRQSVRRRIEAVGGGVQIWSTPGRGTSVMIRVPASAALDGVMDEGARDG